MALPQKISREPLRDSGDNQYAEARFWQKLKNSAGRAGRRLTQTALTLFFALQDSDTPGWARAVIIGALAYFILPTDMIPDVLPSGYVDDLGALLAALKALSESIKPEHEQKARDKTDKLFGNNKPERD